MTATGNHTSTILHGWWHASSIGLAWSRNTTNRVRWTNGIHSCQEEWNTACTCLVCLQFTHSYPTTNSSGPGLWASNHKCCSPWLDHIGYSIGSTVKSEWPCDWIRQQTGGCHGYGPVQESTEAWIPWPTVQEQVGTMSRCISLSVMCLAVFGQDSWGEQHWWSLTGSRLARQCHGDPNYQWQPSQQGCSSSPSNIASTVRPLAGSIPGRPSRSAWLSAVSSRRIDGRMQDQPGGTCSTSDIHMEAAVFEPRETDIRVWCHSITI